MRGGANEQTSIKRTKKVRGSGRIPSCLLLSCAVRAHGRGLGRKWEKGRKG